MFVSARRDVGAAESTVAVYRDQIRVYSNLRLNIGVDLTNKTAVAYVLTMESASTPVAVLSLPVVLLPSAKSPLAVFRMPVVLSPSADDPLAVLKLPVALFTSADAPVAVF